MGHTSDVNDLPARLDYCFASTLLRDRFAIRVAITNHRTRNVDLDLFVAELLAIGREVAAERGSETGADGADRR